jgi:hypothetical protein
MIAQAGYVCYSMDLPGHGSSPGVRGYVEEPSHLTEDGLQMATHIHVNICTYNIINNNNNNNQPTHLVLLFFFSIVSSHLRAPVLFKKKKKKRQSTQLNL